jgi:hypothetical protein
VALRDTLERAGIPQLGPFVVRPEGTRQERTAHTIAPLTRQARWSRAWFRLHKAMTARDRLRPT